MALRPRESSRRMKRRRRRLDAPRGLVDRILKGKIVGHGVGRMPPRDVEGRAPGGARSGRADVELMPAAPYSSQPSSRAGGGRGFGTSVGNPRCARIFRMNGRVLDGRDELHSATAPRAGEDVDLECPTHQIGPRPISSVLACRCGRVAPNSGGLQLLRLRAAVGHDQLPQSGVRGEHARRRG